MTVQQDENGNPGPPLAVADTQLVSAILVGRRRNREAGLLDRYASHIRGKSLVRSFATVCELRYGCLKAGWAPARTERMETWFREVAAIVMPDNDLVTLCASLRDTCRRNGHALSDKIHDSDRWIASTAIRYKIPRSATTRSSGTFPVWICCRNGPSRVRKGRTRLGQAGDQALAINDAVSLISARPDRRTSAHGFDHSAGGGARYLGSAEI